MASSDAIGAEEMAIDGAVSQTAVEAWDERWATSEGRADWLEPHPALVAIPISAARMAPAAREGASVVTIEGLSSDEAMSPLQTAFRKHHVLQCGFCTPGMLTTAHALVTEEPDADADRIRSALSNNLCRCTGRILCDAAVLEARSAYRKADKP